MLKRVRYNSTPPRIEIYHALKKFQKLTNKGVKPRISKIEVCLPNYFGNES